jgi:hypothetical protein
MLADWQITLLDNSFWILPLLTVLGLAAFPWRHWNSLFDQLEGRESTFFKKDQISLNKSESQPSNMLNPTKERV